MTIIRDNCTITRVKLEWFKNSNGLFIVKLIDVPTSQLLAKSTGDAIDGTASVNLYNPIEPINTHPIALLQNEMDSRVNQISHGPADSNPVIEASREEFKFMYTCAAILCESYLER